jgi:hypothetical protein
MLRVSAKYVSRIPKVRSDAAIASDQLVRWGAATLLSLVRLSILNYPGGPIVDTGNMLSSVTMGILAPAKAAVWVGAEYAVFVEYGTRYVDARPFFGDAIERFQPEFQGRVRNLDRR